MWDSQAIIRARHKKLSHICSVLARSKRGEGGRDGKNVGLIFTFAMCLLAESIHFHFPELDEFQICQLTCNSLTESVTTDGVTAQTPLASRAELPEGAKPPPLVYQLEHFCYTARKMVTCTRKVQPSEDALSSLPYVYEFVCRTIIRITGQEMLWSATRNPSGLVFFEVAEDLKDVPICAIALSTGCLRAWVSGTSSLESALCDDQPSTSEPATFVPLTEMAPARIDAEEIMANYQQMQAAEKVCEELLEEDAKEKADAQKKKEVKASKRSRAKAKAAAAAALSAAVADSNAILATAAVTTSPSDKSPTAVAAVTTAAAAKEADTYPTTTAAAAAAAIGSTATPTTAAAAAAAATGITASIRTAAAAAAASQASSSACIPPTAVLLPAAPSISLSAINIQKPLLLDALTTAAIQASSVQPHPLPSVLQLPMATTVNLQSLPTPSTGIQAADLVLNSRVQHLSLARYQPDLLACSVSNSCSTRSHTTTTTDTHIADRSHNSTQQHVDVDAEVPDCFTCPITQCLMLDPVMTVDGHTYERVNITQWLVKSDCAPVTGLPLDSNRVVPNWALKKAIDEFQIKRQNLPTNETSR